MPHFLDPLVIVQTVGLLGVSLIIFAESGLFFGFFLPGDSLLFTAGLIASQGHINIVALLFLTFAAAVLGDNVGYWFGARVGPKLFTRERSFIFRPEHIVKTKAFYERYGKKTIILARFIPIVRTFAPILAGVGAMHYRTFFSYNLIGGALWTFGVTLLGYILGSLILDIDRYLLPIIALIIFTSFL